MVTPIRETGIDPALLVRVSEIARLAGAVILQHYRRGVAVDWKADRTPVTAADRAAHETIVEALAEASPGTPIVSEEGWVPDPVAQRELDRFWLVDPLDGTKEFLSGNGEFTVNIALIEGGVPELAVVYAPALDLLYRAARSWGAWKIADGGPPVRLASEPVQPDRPCRVVESRSHPSPELEGWLSTVPVARRVAVGSSLKFCWVADGTADVYPRFGPTMEWDVAAGDGIFRWSGRREPRRSPLVYNKPGFRNAAFVIGLEQWPEEVSRVP